VQAEVRDPLTDEIVLPPNARAVDEDTGWFLDHFSRPELERFLSHGAAAFVARVGRALAASIAVCLGAGALVTARVTSLSDDPGVIAVLAIVVAGFALAVVCYHLVRLWQARRLAAGAVTRETVGARMDELNETYKEITESFYDELTDILIMADVGVKTSDMAVQKLRERCTKDKIKDTKRAREVLKEILVGIMGSEPMRLSSPMVLLVVGVNGVGKTTTIGKLASRLMTVGRRVIICAGDTFRAAAADQPL
jgi:hypothetical protein